MAADVNLQNNDGDTPLHLAARYEMEYIVKLLLHYDADVNITNKKGETAVNLIKNNKYPHVKVLLENNVVYSKGNYNFSIFDNTFVSICFQKSVPKTNWRPF